jgi:CRISPR-associated protein (Cas_Cmr5)
MSSDERVQTREQRIVGSLQQALPHDEAALRSFRARALDLPAMLRRHGLMHVLLFLAGKEGSDRQLAGLLHQGIAAALGKAAGPAEMAKYAESLAGMEMPVYLLHWEAAQQSATWLKLLIEARTKVSSTMEAAATGGEGTTS